MTRARAASLLRGLFTVMGAVVIATGVWSVLIGSDGQIGDAAATPDVETEFRFYAVFWIGFGAASLWIAPQVECRPGMVRALAALLFLGGIARGIAWVDEGRPHAFYIVLLALELLIPVAVLLLQRRMAGLQR